MICKISNALGKEFVPELADLEETKSNIYSLRIYDTELIRLSMEKQGLSGLVAEIIFVNIDTEHLMPLDM